MVDSLRYARRNGYTGFLRERGYTQIRRIYAEAGWLHRWHGFFTDGTDFFETTQGEI